MHACVRACMRACVHARVQPCTELLCVSPALFTVGGYRVEVNLLAKKFRTGAHHYERVRRRLIGMVILCGTARSKHAHLCDCMV